MSRDELIVERLEDVLEALTRIPRRFTGIKTPEDFYDTPEGQVGPRALFGDSADRRSMRTAAKPRLVPKAPNPIPKGAQGMGLDPDLLQQLPTDFMALLSSRAADGTCCWRSKRACLRRIARIAFDLNFGARGFRSRSGSRPTKPCGHCRGWRARRHLSASAPCASGSRS